MEIDAVWKSFLTAEFAVASVAVLAIVTTGKKMTPTQLLQKGWFRSFLAAQNLLWGLILAIPKFLPGEKFGQRALLGLCAGFMSQFLYQALLKRFGVGEEKNEKPAQPEA